MLERFRERGLVKVRGRQRTDATHVLASVRVLNRLELLGETFRAALNALATRAPEWVRSIASAEWFERYAHRVEETRLPRGKGAREEYARTVGEDGSALLEALEAPGAPAGLKNVPAIEILRPVWQRHFECTPDWKPPAGGVRLRPDREWNRRRPPRCLVGGPTARAHPHIPLRSAHRMNSPTVSGRFRNGRTELLLATLMAASSGAKDCHSGAAVDLSVWLAVRPLQRWIRVAAVHPRSLRAANREADRLGRRTVTPPRAEDP